VTRPRKFVACRSATGANWRKLPARQVECELRQHGRNTTQVGRAGMTPRFYFSLHDRGSVVTEMRWDDLGSWIQINGCSSRAAAAAPIAPRSLHAEYCAGHLPGRSTMDGLLFISVTMHSCTCSDSRAIATGRTSEDSVTRHRMIRRRHVCSVKTLAAGRVLSDANERARSLASMMNT
jgi:hypothetical protein